MTPISLTSVDDPRIAAFRDVRERDLTGREGLFIAEGEVVLNVLTSAWSRCRARAVLLADALARLPEDYRELLVLRHIEERPFEEIAERLERSSGAVRTMWVRALRKLKEAIGAEIELSLRLESGD